MARILVIDDDANVRSVIARALERVGHHVDEVADGEAGLTRLADREFDLVITDLFTPGLDGLQLIRRAADLHPTLPVIAISGGAFAAPQGMLEMARTFGARGTLAKPFELTDLFATVEAALADPGAG